MDLIVHMIFGSHLYGTATPWSDHDYKGVFIPTLDELLLARAPRSLRSTTKVGDGKNEPGDKDSGFYSLHYFLELANKGETVVLDMLHAPPTAFIEAASPIWLDLIANKYRFYTRNLKSFVGYARHQAAKYGVKGSRLAEAKIAREFLAACNPKSKLADVWESLPLGEHMHKLAETNSGITRRMWQVCGKAMTDTALCHHYIPMMDNFIKNYGHRAQLAEINAGIDWKAVSHAFRAGYQVLHILKDGGYSYPLPECDELIRIKTGQVRWAEAGPRLDALLDECEAEHVKSTLPDHVDSKWVDNWLLKQLNVHYSLERIT